VVRVLKSAYSDHTDQLDDEAPDDATQARFEDTFFALSLLWRQENDGDRPVAALVLGSQTSLPITPSPAVLRVLSDRLARVQETTSAAQLTSVQESLVRPG